MQTWEETRCHLREKYQLLLDEPECVCMAWHFPGSPDLQQQRVEPMQVFGRLCLQIISDSAPEHAIITRDALIHNMTLAIGALALSDGVYVVRHLIALDELTWPLLDQALELVAHEATRLRSHLISARAAEEPSLDLTEHWAD